MGIFFFFLGGGGGGGESFGEGGYKNLKGILGKSKLYKFKFFFKN